MKTARAFPTCFTCNLEVGAGPGLLFDTMATVLTVFENILACVREMFGWSCPKGCVFCGIFIATTSMTTALGYSLSWLVLGYFIVSRRTRRKGKT